MFREIIYDDVCDNCRCGATVHEGDTVEFIGNPYSWTCDACPRCEEQVNNAAEKEGEINY